MRTHAANHFQIEPHDKLLFTALEDVLTSLSVWHIPRLIFSDTYEDTVCVTTWSEYPVLFLLITNDT